MPRNALQPANDAPGAAPAPERYTITELAGAFKVTPRTIRFYEDEGLINPTREGAARVYSRGDRARLAWILRAKNVGFTIADIREMIDLYDVGDGRATQRRVTIAKCRERIAALEAQRLDLDETISELAAFVAMLEGLAAPKLKEV